MVQEDLLQRCLSADQPRDRLVCERAEQRLDAPVHLEANRVRAGLGHSDAGQLGEARRSSVERHLDRLGAQVSKLGERALLDQSTGPQDADPVAERFDLTEDVDERKTV